MQPSISGRVLMLLENHPYPQDSRVRQEAAVLISAGYQVSVIAPAGPGQSWYEIHNAVRVYRYPAPPNANGLFGYVLEYGWAMTASFLLSLVACIRSGFDVIHAHNPPDFFVFLAALYKLFGKRFVFDHHDLSPEMYDARFPGRGNRLLRSVLHRCEQVSYRLSDHAIATNGSYKALAVERHAIPAERITVVRNGPALDRLRPMEPIAELRQKAPIIIGYAGTMGFQDGVDCLLRALHHLVNELGRRDFFCLLVGDGDAIESLKSLAAELQLTEQVRFTGWVESAAVPQYLSTADICVAPEPSNPYNDRSTMIKVMEYMAMAKPIVAFDLPEHRISAETAAVYVPDNDELAFARAVAQLMNDPARRQAMGFAGRQRVENALAWRHSAPHLLNAYRSVLTGISTPSRSSTTSVERQEKRTVPYEESHIS